LYLNQLSKRACRQLDKKKPGYACVSLLIILQSRKYCFPEFLANDKYFMPYLNRGIHERMYFIKIDNIATVYPQELSLRQFFFHPYQSFIAVKLVARSMNADEIIHV